LGFKSPSRSVSLVRHAASSCESSIHPVILPFPPIDHGTMKVLRRKR
jgi:hypothetical protein